VTTNNWPPETARRTTHNLRFQQAEGPLARVLNPSPHTPEQATAAARPQPAHQPSERRDHKLCQHAKAKLPLTRENVVPEVGLELHSSPCKHWAPAETCGIRPSPAYVQPSPTAKVCILCTPQKWPFCTARNTNRAPPLRERGLSLRRHQWDNGRICAVPRYDRCLPRGTEHPMTGRTIQQ
jgi:hypothetical protein